MCTKLFNLPRRNKMKSAMHINNNSKNKDGEAKKKWEEKLLIYGWNVPLLYFCWCCCCGCLKI